MSTVQAERLRNAESSDEIRFLIGDDVLCSERKSVSVFLPSLEEIALHCERFQASWSEAERFKRLRGRQAH